MTPRSGAGTGAPLTGAARIVALVVALAVGPHSAGLAAHAASPSVATPASVCSLPDPDPPVYYRIELVTTRRVPGTSYARGAGDVTFRNGSPFGIALATDGSYHYDVRITLEALPEPVAGVYAIWVTSTQLDRVTPVGVLAPGQREISAAVDWNQFLVVVSLEPSAEAVGGRWSGPIVMRGISRSGLMHTMAGHGPFQQENCAAYGYD